MCMTRIQSNYGNNAILMTVLSYFSHTLPSLLSTLILFLTFLLLLSSRSPFSQLHYSLLLLFPFSLFHILLHLSHHLSFSPTIPLSLLLFRPFTTTPCNDSLILVHHEAPPPDQSKSLTIISKVLLQRLSTKLLQPELRLQQEYKCAVSC